MPNPLVELTRCFNPCFIGTYSITLLALVDPGLTVTRFNPCFIGTYSITKKIEIATMLHSSRFNPCFIGTYSITESCSFN